jgi:chemotaxis protein MotB
MAKRGRNRNGGGSVVIKRVEEGGHGHHGGAWKVAYADFVTAMMAFFLLMWLLNATTEEQRRGISDYFNPTHLMARSSSGSGQPFGGQTPHSTGDMTRDSGALRVQQGRQPVMVDLEDEDDSDTQAQPVPRREAPPGPDEEAERRGHPALGLVPGEQGGGAAGRRAAQEAGPEAEVMELARAAAAQQGREVQATDIARAARAVAARDPSPADLARAAEAALRQEIARREEEALRETAERLRQAVGGDPQLADLARHLLIEQVPEGLRIQLVDAERQPMFALGSAVPNERLRALIARVAQAIAPLPNRVAISGHTDDTPFRGSERSNWDLSAERANMTRRLLTEAGLDDRRVESVTGMAYRQPLVPENPGAAANRRVSILLLRDTREAPAR